MTRELAGVARRLIAEWQIYGRVIAVRSLGAGLDDWWLGVQCRSANRLTPLRRRHRARLYGELFALTGTHVAGWPYRYLSEFTEGEERASTRP